MAIDQLCGELTRSGSDASPDSTTSSTERPVIRLYAAAQAPTSRPANVVAASVLAVVALAACCPQTSGELGADGG